MNNINELDNWKHLLEQAYEHGFTFDKEIVSDMIQTIEEQEKTIESLKIEFEKLYDNWALGNYDDRKFFIEMRDMINRNNY